MKITIHEEKNSHFTFHGEKKGRSRVTKIPFTTLSEGESFCIEYIVAAFKAAIK